jgi:hypothetical protein
MSAPLITKADELINRYPRDNPIGEACWQLAYTLVDLMPDSKAADTALDHLENTMMWAQRAATQ